MSSTEVLESTPNPDAVSPGEAVHGAQEGTGLAAEGHEGPDHAAHEQGGHSHEGHSHAHGPALNPECTREIEINLPAGDISKEFRKVVKKYQKLARIPGFRLGKVPESLVRKRFADSIRQDVIEAVLPEQFRAEIDRQGLKPLSQPQVTDIQLADGEPLHFKAAFEVVPDFSVDGYQDIHVARPDVTVSDEEYQAELARVLDSRATMEPVTEDRGLQNGDWAQISFRGEFAPSADASGEEAVPEPVSGEDVQVEVGGADTLESFNAALLGARPGQELKFEVTYPADFGERKLAGKSISYDVEVKGIRRKILPALDDDFVKELGEYETLDDFTTQLRGHIANDKRRRLESIAKDQLMEALIARFNFPVPEFLVQEQIDARLDRGLRALAAQGMRAEDMRKLDFQRLRTAQRDSALAEVKGLLILDRIADSEHIDVTEDEVEQQLQLISVQGREPLETLRARLTEEGNLTKIREQIRREKTGAALFEKLAS